MKLYAIDRQGLLVEGGKMSHLSASGLRRLEATLRDGTCRKQNTLRCSM